MNNRAIAAAVAMTCIMGSFAHADPPRQLLDSVRAGENRQTDIKSETQRTVADLDAIIAEFERNGLGESADVKVLKSIRGVLGTLTDKEMEKVIALLQAARGAGDGGKAALNAAEAVQGQKTIVIQLQQLLLEYQRQQELTALSLRFAALAEDQNKNMKATRALARVAKPGAFDESQNVLLTLQQSEQVAIRDQVAGQLKRLKDLGTDADGTSVEKIAQVLEAAEKSGLSKLLVQATTDLTQARLFSAAVREKAARDQLRILARVVAPPKEPAAALQEAIDFLTGAIAEQTAVVAGAQGLSGDDAAAKAAELEERQADLVDGTDLVRQDIAALAIEAAGELKGAEDKMQLARAAMGQNLQKQAAADNGSAALASLDRARARLVDQLALLKKQEEEKNPIAQAKQLKEQIAALRAAETKLKSETAKSQQVSEQGARQGELLKTARDLVLLVTTESPAAIVPMQAAATDMEAARLSLSAVANRDEAAKSQQSAIDNLLKAEKALDQQIAELEKAKDDLAKLEQAREQVAKALEKERKIEKESAKLAAKEEKKQEDAQKPQENQDKQNEQAKQDQAKDEQAKKDDAQKPQEKQDKQNEQAKQDQAKDEQAKKDDAQKQDNKQDQKADAQQQMQDLAKQQEEAAKDASAAKQDVADAQQDASKALDDARKNMDAAKDKLQQQDAKAANEKAQDAVADLNKAKDSLDQKIGELQQKLGEQPDNQAKMDDLAKQLDQAQKDLAAAQQQVDNAQQQQGDQKQQQLDQAGKQMDKVGDQLAKTAADDKGALPKAADQALDEAQKALSKAAANAAKGDEKQAKQDAADAQKALAQAQAAVAMAQQGMENKSDKSNQQQANQQGKPQPGKPQPGKPDKADEKNAKKSEGERKDDTVNGDGRGGVVARGSSAFMNLPARERDAILQDRKEKYPEEYGAMIEKYAKDLADTDR